MKIGFLFLAGLFFVAHAHAKSFELQHDLTLVDDPGTYSGFSIKAPGDLGKYCNFHGYLGDVPITPIHLDGSPAKPIHAPIQLPATTPNKIVIVKEKELVQYELPDGTQNHEYVTELGSEILGRENSFLIAVCRVPAKAGWLNWSPLDHVPTLAELGEIFKDQFLVRD